MASLLVKKVLSDIPQALWFAKSFSPGLHRIIQDSVWSAQLPFGGKRHAAMIKTAEWEIYKMRGIEHKWDIFHGIGQRAHLGLPNVERMVGFASGWNLLK